ncbi:MAG: hypothetical protein IIA67_07215, partial [Planctomycetes bacterium]|nr:hypothetical protein [Planctomycetota bacterium]
MKLPFNNLRGGRSSLALRQSSSYSSSLRLEQLEERRLLAVAPLEFDDIEAAPADASAAFLGPNLIVNGSFDLPIDGVTGWLTPEGGVTTELVDGNRVARIVRRSVDPQSQILQEVAVSSNTTYRIEFDLITTSIGGGTRADFNVFTTGGNLIDARFFAGGNEHHVFDLSIGANVDVITVQFVAETRPRDFTVDNVSVREFVNVPIDGGLGRELIDSGTFDTAADLQADWATPNGGVVWDAGEASIVRLTGQPKARLRQGIATVPDTTYLLEFDLVAPGASADDVVLEVFKGDPPDTLLFSASFSGGGKQHHVFSFNAGAGDDAFTIQFTGNTVNRTFTVDNVSVREKVSVPLEIGVELVANGSFDSAGGGFDDLSGWRVLGNAVTWDNGAARVNRISGNPSIEQTIRTVLGAAHRVEFDLSGAAAGEATVAVLDGDGVVLAVGVFGSGSHGFDVFSVDKSLTVRAAASSPGGNFTLDNVSVRITELPPDPDAGNLVTNGRFDRDDQLAGWLVSDPAGVRWELAAAPDDVNDGVVRITSLHPNINDPNLPVGAAGANIQQQIDVSPSLQHRLEFDLITTNIGGGSRVDFFVFAGAVGGPTLLSERLFAGGDAHRIFSFISPADGPITIQFKAVRPNKDFTVDNIVLRELIRKPFDVAGFEVGEGYFNGFVDGQDGWTSIVDPAEGAHSSPLVSSDNPNSGSQHLRIEKNVGLPAVDSDNLGPFNGAISGANVVEPGLFGLSIDVAISARNGADYDVIAQANSRNDITGQVRFESTGAILAADDVGRGRELIDTGATWTPGVYRTLDVIVDPGEDRIVYQYNGIEIYSTEGSGRGGVFGADVIEEVILKSNNAHIGDHADFDNLQIANLSGGTIQPPDLARALPRGWSDSIVTSTEVGTNTDTPIIDPGETIFADFAVSNIGLFEAGEYSAQWKILNDVGGTVRTGEIAGGALSPLETEAFEDVNIGPLPAGDYTISLDIDFEGVVDESNEDNNTVVKALTIGTTDEGTIDAEPFSRFGPLGGLVSVSDGPFGRINVAGDSDNVRFFGQVGETISAIVTPIDPAARLSLRLNGAAVAGPGAPGAAVFMSPRSVTSDGFHTLSISGTAASDYEVRLVRNATIEMTDSSIGSGLSLDSSSVLGRTGVLAKTHNGADVDEFTVSLTIGHRVDVVLDGVTADFSGQTLQLFSPGGALL